jgi:hypothetical protein
MIGNFIFRSPIIVEKDRGILFTPKMKCENAKKERNYVKAFPPSRSG